MLWTQGFQALTCTKSLCPCESEFATNAAPASKESGTASSKRSLVSVHHDFWDFCPLSCFGIALPYRVCASSEAKLSSAEVMVLERKHARWKRLVFIEFQVFDYKSRPLRDRRRWWVASALLVLTRLSYLCCSSLIGRFLRSSDVSVSLFWWAYQ